MDNYFKDGFEKTALGTGMVDAEGNAITHRGLARMYRKSSLRNYRNSPRSRFRSPMRKTAGLLSSIDDIAKAAKTVSTDGAEVVHKFDPEQLKKILDATDKLKPSIKPIHLLGASILAGAGFPVGQYIGARAKDVTEAVLETPGRVGESIARNMPQRPYSDPLYNPNL